LLLTFLITIWRSFYDSKPSEQSAQRLIVRHKVSLVFQFAQLLQAEDPGHPWGEGSGESAMFGGSIRTISPTTSSPSSHRSARDHEGVSGVQDPR